MGWHPIWQGSQGGKCPSVEVRASCLPTVTSDARGEKEVATVTFELGIQFGMGTRGKMPSVDVGIMLGHCHLHIIVSCNHFEEMVCQVVTG